MINWFAIVLVSLGAMAGAELGRRRAEKKGTPVSRLPLIEQRVYGVVGAFSGALFIELAGVALAHPTEKHVWFLIGASVLAFASVTTHLTRELKLAQRERAGLQNSA